MPWIRDDLCIGCGACQNVCPVSAISLSNGKAAIDQSTCVKCGRCFDVCPKGAIRPNSENPTLAGGFSGRGRGGMGRRGGGFGRRGGGGRAMGR